MAEDDIKLLATMALGLKKVDSENSILVVEPGANAAGVWELGVRTNFSEIAEMVRSGECRGLFVFGEDPIGKNLLTSAEATKLELLVVTTPVINTLAQLATVVLPGSTSLETEGCYLIAGNYEKLNKVCPPAERDNLEVIDALSASVRGDTCADRKC